MKDKSKQKEKEIRVLKTGDEYDILKGFEINTSFPNKNFELKKNINQIELLLN